MAKSLKEKGLEEAKCLQQRVRRQHMLRRISRKDYDELEFKLESLIDYIAEMEEEDGD